MKSLLFSFLLLAAFVIPGTLQAQNITGTWEGYMDEEFIQINIEQRGNQLCGFTYDYELRNKGSYCIATFDGLYEPSSKQYMIGGKRIVENSGSHVRMRMIFRLGNYNGRTELVGQVTTATEGGFSPGRVDMRLKKVSSRPQRVPGIEAACFPAPARPAIKRPTTPATSKPPVATTKPATPKPPATASKPQTVPKPGAPVVKPGSPKPAAPKATVPAAPKPLPQKKDTVIASVSGKVAAPVTLRERDILQNMKMRRKSEQNRLEVNVKKINLKVFDNGTVDNDTVSIFYNGRLLLSHQRLSETPIVLDIELKDDVDQHEIIMYAENLGGIPPNTALIVVTAGDKRYELRSKASLEENAVLVIAYKPKPF